MARRPADQMAYRRKGAQMVEDQMAYNEQNRVIVDRALWEVTTTQKIKQRRRKEREAGLMGEEEDQLNDRRRAVAALYTQEMGAWRQEMNNRAETTEERKNHLRARAEALRDAREHARKSYVEEQYTNQWRLACDDARMLDSKAVTKYVTQQRRGQVDVKRQQDAKDADAEADYVSKWRRQMAELDATEDDKHASRHGMEEEVRGILDGQVGDLEVRRRELKERTKADAELELQEWQEAKDKEDNKAMALQVAAHSRGREVRAFNEKRLGTREARKAVERTQDLELLRYALWQENKNNAADAEKKRYEKEMNSKYKAYLSDQMIKETADNSKVDALRKELENRIWKQRDDDQRKQTDAREYLMRQTDAGRQSQIADKAARDAQALEAYHHENDFEVARLDELDRLEAEKNGARKAAVMENVGSLRTQMDSNVVGRVKEEQEKFLLNKMMEMEEARHSEKLANQAGVVNMYRPLKHSTWYT